MTAPSWFSRDIWPEDAGADVSAFQRIVGLAVTGVADPPTVAAVRGLQRIHDLPMTGVIDMTTAKKTGDRARKNKAPGWFTRDLELWTEGEDVRAARAAFGLDARDDRYCPDMEAAVRRFQSERSLPLTGVVDKETATAVAVD